MAKLVKGLTAQSLSFGGQAATLIVVEPRLFALHLLENMDFFLKSSITSRSFRFIHPKVAIGTWNYA